MAAYCRRAFLFPDFRIAGFQDNRENRFMVCTLAVFRYRKSRLIRRHMIHMLPLQMLPAFPSRMIFCLTLS